MKEVMVRRCRRRKMTRNSKPERGSGMKNEFKKYFIKNRAQKQDTMVLTGRK